MHKIIIGKFVALKIHILKPMRWCYEIGHKANQYDKDSALSNPYHID